MSLIARQRFALGLVVTAVTTAMAAGCFALFPLDDYGPGTDAGLRDRSPPPPDTSVVTPDATTFDPTAKLVFLSSATLEGTLGGLDGADQECQALATSARLPGTYKAWLSANNQSPATRFALLSPEAGVSTTFRLVDTTGRVLADNWRDFLEVGRPQVAIDRDEHAAQVGPDYDAAVGSCESLPFTPVWSNTARDAGISNLEDCSFWSGTSGPAGSGRVGVVSAEPTVWTSACSLPCDQKARLYCFQQ